MDWTDVWRGKAAEVACVVGGMFSVESVFVGFVRFEIRWSQAAGQGERRGRISHLLYMCRERCITSCPVLGIE